MQRLTERPDIPDVKWFHDGAYAPRLLSTEEIRQIKRYLADVFGIQLAESESITCKD